MGAIFFFKPFHAQYIFFIGACVCMIFFSEVARVSPSGIVSCRKTFLPVVVCTNFFFVQVCLRDIFFKITHPKQPITATTLTSGGGEGGNLEKIYPEKNFLQDTTRWADTCNCRKKISCTHTCPEKNIYCA